MFSWNTVQGEQNPLSLPSPAYDWIEKHYGQYMYKNWSKERPIFFFFFCNSCPFILWTKISRTAAGKLRNYIYILNFHTFLMLNFLVWTINEQKKKNRIFVIPYLIWVYTQTLCNFMTWAEKWYWYWPFMKLFAHFLLSYNLCKTYLKWCIFIL